MNRGLRTFSVWLAGHEEHVTTIHHTTAGKAKYEYLLSVGDAFPDGLPWNMVRCRSLGVFRPDAFTDSALEQVQSQRGRQDLRLGARARWDWSHMLHSARPLGTVVGADGGYVFIILDGGDARLRVHPGELHVVEEAACPTA